MRIITSSLVLLLAVSTLCKLHQDALYRSQGGVKLKLGIYKRWQARSRIHCSQRCLQDSNCWGYNFNKASRQCQYGVRTYGEHTFEASQQDVSFGVVDLKTDRSSEYNGCCLLFPLGGGGGGGDLGYLGGRIRSLSKLKNTPKALIIGQKSTLILIKTLTFSSK